MLMWADPGTPPEERKRSKLLHIVTQFSQIIYAALFVPPSFPIKKIQSINKA